MKRSKPDFSGSRSSASDSSAMEAMCAARATQVPTSPRASVMGLPICRGVSRAASSRPGGGGAGGYGAAARYLEIPASLASRGPELARRLKAVLDRHFWIDMDLVSDTEERNTSNGLARDVEEVARIPGAEGSADPVKMVRVRGGGHAAWLFAAGTVNHVDTWYDQLRHRWVLDHLPQPLLRPGPRELLWWQWLALPILVVVAWALALLAARISVALLARFAARTTASWDDALVRRLPGPARLGGGLLFAPGGGRL